MVKFTKHTNHNKNTGVLSMHKMKPVCHNSKKCLLNNHSDTHSFHFPRGLCTTDKADCRIYF